MGRGWKKYLYIITVMFFALGFFNILFAWIGFVCLILPWNIPQLFDFGVFPDWSVHLSFRIYSMMFTTTILGLLLAWFLGRMAYMVI